MRYLMLTVFLGFARQEAAAIIATGGTISNAIVDGVPCRVHTFAASGAITNFQVTGGSGRVTVMMWGGGGGGTAGTGGAGGFSKGEVTVASGQELKVLVGKGGQGERYPALGGWPNGGNSLNSRAGFYGAGGGGRSAVTTSGGVDLIVAGGGGAGGAHDNTSTSGGAGGGVNGQDAPASYWYSISGKGGTQTAGGSGGSSGGTAGSFHQGGVGDAFNGTGGGDGYYGGGAGDDHQGGGGGSGYVGGSGVINATTTAGNYQTPANTSHALYQASAGSGGGGLADGANGLVIVYYASNPVTVSGRIVNAATGAGLHGATVVFSNGGGSTTTSNGVYKLDVQSGWSGTIAPSYPEGTYVPASIAVPAVTQATAVADMLWTPSPWLNFGYAKRVPFEVRNEHTSALANYQVELKIPYQADMRPDMADIQMGDMQGNPLPFWTERVTTNSQAVVWVKIPSLAALGTTNVYLYYGNSSVTNRGDGDAVFRFFDDFEDGVINTNKWPLRNLGTCITESNGALKVTMVNGSNYYLQSGTYPASTVPFVLECRTRTLAAPYNGWSPMQWMNVAGGSELNMMEHGANMGQYVGIDYGYPWTIPSVPLGEYHRNSIAVSAANRYRMTSQYDSSSNCNLDSWSAGLSNCATMSGNYRIRMVARGDGWGGGDQGMDGEVDAIWMRSYCPVEPSSRILSNTMLSLTNAFVVYPVSGRVRNGSTGEGVGGVRIRYAKGVDVFTSSSGYYTQWMGAAWSGTIAPSHVDGTFAPTSLAVAALSQATAVADILWTPSPWANFGYANRVQLEIRNEHTSALANYQVELKVPYQAGMRPDMADIQMGDMQGNPLPFWTERVTTNSQAVVWVKIPSLAALGTTNVYLYYGNSSVTNRGDGDAVFRFFDDFEDGVINTSKWATRSLGAYIAETNGHLVVTGTEGNNYYLQSTGFSTAVQLPLVLESRARTPAVIVHGWSPFAFVQAYPSTTGLGLVDYYHGSDFSQSFYVDGNWIYAGYKMLDGYHRNSLIIPNNTNYVLQTAFETQTFYNASNSGSMASVASKTYYIKIGPRPDYYAGGTGTGTVDAIWMRSYCPVEPSSSILSNTMLSLTNAFVVYPVSGRVRNGSTGEGVGGVRIRYTKGVDVFTTAGGYYTQWMGAAWSGTITPSHVDGTFAPTSLTVAAISQATTVADILWTPTSWMNYGYSKRVQMEIRNQHTAALSQYQVELKIPHLMGMRPDLADIQIGDTRGNPLPFWTERVVTNNHAVVWIKVPSLAALATTNIYVYYGNASVTNRGDGEAVFRFFDDFGAGEINTNKWPYQSRGNAYITQSNGLLKTWAVYGTNYFLESSNFTTALIPFALECRTRSVSAAYNGWTPLQWRNTTGSSELSAVDHGYGSRQYALADYAEYFVKEPQPLSEHHRISLAVLGANYFRTTCAYESSLGNNWDSWAAGKSNCLAMSGSYRIRMGSYHSNTGQGMDGEVDAVWIRAACPVEPTETVLSNTLQTLTNACQVYPVSGRVRNSFNGEGVGGVRIGFTKGVEVFTSSSGCYTQWMGAAWSGTVTPSHGIGRFAPTSLVVAAISQATVLPDLYWAPPPSATGLSPAVGVFSGGTTVLITGTNFSSSPLPVVWFGARAGTGLTRINATTLSVVTPSNAPGQGVDVRIVNGDGQSCVLTNAFTYRHAAPVLQSVAPNRGNVEGGYPLILTGQNFIGASLYGSGSDGSITVDGVRNLNTEALAEGRTQPDAVNFSVTELTTNYARVTPTPPAGSLVAGDEVLLINLQGRSAAYTNAGNYEVLRVAAVETNVIRFAKAKTRFYGDGVANDSNIGTAATSQRVMLQRIPNYKNVAILSSGTLTASPWDGVRGGVLCIRASGAVTNNGLIDMTAQGYRSGRWSVDDSTCSDNIATEYGESYLAPSGVGTARNGGGSGGNAAASGGFIASPFVPSTAGHATTGQLGYAASGRTPGTPGGTYGQPDLAQIFFGSGGAGGFSCWGGGGPGLQGPERGGGGIVMVQAVQYKGQGTIAADGNVGSMGQGASSGGSVLLMADAISTTGQFARAMGGTCISAENYNYNMGGEGRVAVQCASALACTSAPAAYLRTASTGGDLKVFVGTNPAVVWEVTDSSTIKVICPPGTCGVVPVTVRCGDGQTTTLANAFTYMPEIRGVVTNDLTGAGVTNVAVASRTGNYSTTTGVGGAYALLVPLGWTGQVSAATALPGLLTPTSRPYANVRTILTNQDYAFSPANPMISGYVSNAVTGVMLDGVTVNFSAGGGQTITADGGYYSRTLPYGWTGTVTLAYTTAQGAHTFAPASRGYTNLILAFTNQNYACSPPYYSGPRYVSLSGLNQYPYTNWESAAWSLQAAINSCRGGETITVGDGVYDVDSMITVDRAVTIRSVNGPTTTIVQRVSGNGGLVNVVATNAVVDGLTIRGGYLSAYFVYYREVVYGIGSAAGVALYNSSTLQNCIVRDCVAAGMDVPGGVRLESGAKAINCLIYNNSSGPFDYNMNSLVGGVWMGTNSYLVNSVVYGNTGYGIYRRSEYYTEGVGGVFKAPGANVYVDNCLIWNNTGGDLRGLPGGLMYVRNSTYQSADNAVSPNVYCMRGDPGFVDAAAGNFRLQPGSLAINSGLDGYNTLTNDILMKPRKVFGIDRGAYEYTGVLYRVSGRVTNEYYPALGLENALLTCSGGVTATTEPNGYYVALLNQNWTGTVTPSYPNGFFLAPASYTVGAGLTNELRDRNFSWRPPHPFLNGRITHGITGVGLDGVSVYFSNGAGTTLTTNGGWYSQMVTGRWSGVVTSYFAAGGSFTPASRSLSSVLTNQFDLDYVWTPAVQTISGRVTNYFTGASVTGVLVQFSSGGGVCTSGVNGVYTGRLYHGWSGRATPSHPWSGTFLPVEYREYELLSTNVANQDYAWVPADPVISGQVTNSFNGLGAEGVVLTFSGGQGVVTTAQDGVFTMTVPYGWTGTVTPSHVVGTFAASWRSYTNLTTNAASQGFRWTPDLRSISGRITHGDTGAGLTNVTVYFSNGGGSAVTTNGGYYTRSLYYTWHGVAAPSGIVNMTAAPVSRSYESITSAIPDQDYVLYPHRTISGQVIHQDTGTGVDGMSIQCTGTNDLVTANGGYFSTVVAHGWSGVLRPQPTDGHCVATQRTYSAVSADMAEQSFVWHPSRTISGRVTNRVSGVGVDGVQILLGGVPAGTTFNGGYFVVATNQGWSGTVAPALAGWVFLPASASVANLAANQVMAFGGTAESVLVTGRVVNFYTTQGVAGVTVTFANGGGSALTDNNGSYVGQVPFNWSGTATVSIPAGGAFDPAQRTYAGLQATAGGQDYVWTPPALTVGGTLTDGENGAPLAFVVVTNSTGGFASSQADGRYELTVYHGWSGTVTPAKAMGSFQPLSRSYAGLVSNRTDQSFVWRSNRVVSGQVTNGLTGTNLAGVVVALSGGAGSMVTTNDGLYSLPVPYGWSGTLTATFTNWLSVPGGYAFSNVVVNQSGKNLGMHAPRLISGRVVNHQTGAGIANVGLQISGAGWSGATQTLSDGCYTSAVPYGWSGTLTPQLPTGVFVPTNRSYEGVTVNVTNQEFRWIQPNPIIRGRVVNLASGGGVLGVTVRCSDGSSTVTDSQGQYSLTKTFGWTGNCWPVYASGTFADPAIASVSNLTEDLDGQDFGWTPPDPRLGGRITHVDTGDGLDGIVVHVGGQPDAVTTNGGYFQVVVPLHWSGAVAPAAATGVFAPVTRSCNNLIADQTNLLFAWNPGRTISGRITESMGEEGLVGVVVRFSNGGGEVATTNGGYYVQGVAPGWSGTATPSLAGGTFQPEVLSYPAVWTDQTNRNYVWTPAEVAGNRYVSRTGSQTYPYTNWAMAATSIHAAVNAALPGEIVWLTNEVYELQRTVEVTKPIRIRSVNGAHFTTLRQVGATPSRVLRVAHGNAEVSGVTLTGGRADSGSGAYVQSGFLNNAIVCGNTNESNRAGAGVALGNSVSARIANCLIYGNRAAGATNAAGLSGEGSVVNCTIYDNVPGGAQASAFYNCIIEGVVQAPLITYTLASQIYAGAGNRTGDPRFENRAAGNYRLLIDSPCLNAGHDGYNVLSRDLDYQPRVLYKVDLGAYERQPDNGLALTMWGETNPVPRGDAFTYSVAVINAGQDPVAGIVVTSSIPAGFAYVSSSDGAEYDSASGAWTVGTLAGGEQRTLTLLTEARLPGMWTNGARITAGEMADSDSNYLQAEYVARIMDDVVITNLNASTSSGNSTVKWDSVVGVGYSIYTSDDSLQVQQDPAWEERATMVASDELRHFMDTDTASAAVTRRYYQVAFSGHEPAVSNFWALIRTDAKPGYTLVSPPVLTDRRFDGELGRMLAEPLNGNDGGVGSGADEVFIYQADGSWRTLYLDASKTWREADGIASTYELPAGSGLWISRKSGTAARLTFTGPVGNAGTNAVALQPGFNLIGLSEGKDLPLEQTLADAGPQAGATEETADQLVIQKADGSWRFLMFVTNWGAPYDGHWFDLNASAVAPAMEKMEPGAAYYYLRRGSATEISF